ncbi:YfdX family protein [Plesiomonas sp.]|uniref:YfdX family protein n=1 Tax=Plesiomonas sp. TaxID=2486279 RepID=UPI003F3BD19B
MKNILSAVALSVAIFSTGAMAAEQPVAPAVSQQQQKDALQVAQQGFSAMMNVQRARAALFNGQPAEAQKLVLKAKTELANDSIDWTKFIKIGKTAPLAGDNYVIVNASMSVAEDFVPTPIKQKAISTANEKIKAGDRKGALDTLRLAGIGIVENQALMPLKQTQQHVNKAIELMKEGQYYEANLALKGAEDGIIIDSESLIGTPVTASHSAPAVANTTSTSATK